MASINIMHVELIMLLALVAIGCYNQVAQFGLAYSTGGGGGGGGGGFGLSYQYYAIKCPFAGPIVRDVVRRNLRRDLTLSAGLLRMHFHDCFVQGCDASILLNSTTNNTTEKESPANLSLRGYEVIDEAKEELEEQCPGVVSCADIVAMAARDAVYFSGGPFYQIPYGRKDGRRSKIQDTASLPSPLFNITQLINTFGQHGFTTQEMVVLSGGHTLGVARCASFKNRLHKFDTTHDVDPTLNPDLAEKLIGTCQAGDSAKAPFDDTRTVFDSAYFDAVQMGRGLLSSDETLFLSAKTRPYISNYAANQDLFFFDFTKAMQKMGMIGVKDWSNGEVRKDCQKVN